MDGRIGELAIEYCTSAGHTLAPGLTPAIDRAIRAGLGEALEQELAALDADRSVIVIRTLRADVAIGPGEWSLDRRCAERVGHAAAQAMGATLAAGPSDDEVKRFADQADFVSAYIIDVLSGTSDRWYYGAFRPYERGPADQRISAVLSDHRHDAGRVFARLAQRGRLEQVLALIGAPAMHALVSARSLDDARPTADVSALADAAIDLLSSVGWPIDAARRRMLHDLAGDHRVAPAPAWIDRRELSRWVRQFAGQATDRLRRSGVKPGLVDAEEARALRRGKLDWLDAAWLESRLAGLGADALDNRSSRDEADEPSMVLAAIASRLQERRLKIDRGASRDEVAVQLLSAGYANLDGEAVLDSGDGEALERIADAWELIAADLDSTRRFRRLLEGTEGSEREPDDDRLVAGLSAVRVCGPTAIDILRAAVVVAIADADRGTPTEGGGLYLMTRALLDVRFDAIVRDSGIPLDIVLAGLAGVWCNLRAPLDPAVACWCASGQIPGSLDEHVPLLRAIEASLSGRLVGQKTLDEVATDGWADDRSESYSSAVLIERIADLLMRAWQRWLPGLSSSSASFVIANCLKRRARVRIDAYEIRVELESAPFDVVLEMAGYLRPIEQVPWLDRRRVTFDVVRTPTA